MITVLLTIGREHHMFGGKTLEDTRNACVFLYNMKYRHPRAEELSTFLTSQYCKILDDYLEKLHQYYPDADLELIPDEGIKDNLQYLLDIIKEELMKVRADPSVVDPTITITLDEEGKRIC